MRCRLVELQGRDGVNKEEEGAVTARLISSDSSLTRGFPRDLPEFFEHGERWAVRRREEEEIKSDGWDDTRLGDDDVEALK